MNFKKELTGVAAKVAEIMEAELSAKQKAIAKLDHPKHKIDAGDLAKLRAGHKPVKEEADQLDEVSLKTKVSAFAKRTQRGWDNDYAPEDDGVDHAGKAEKTLKHIEKRHGSKAVAKANKAGVRAIFGKGSVMEAEQVEEGIEDRIEAARKKAKAAGKKVEEPKKPAAPAKRKVEGKAYGGAKQKEEMEESVLPFTAMLEAYTEHGLKAFVNEQVEEEIQEEVDYLEEAKDGKIDLTHAFKQHGLHFHMTDYYTNSGARKDRSVKSHEEAMKRIHKKVSDDHGPKVAEDMHKHSQSMANSWYRGDDAPKSAAALRAKHKVKWDGDIDKVDDKPDPKFHKEEVDNETYTKEVEDQKASMEGKKKQPKVAAAATQGVKIMDEEVEYFEEEVEQVEYDPEMEEFITEEEFMQLDELSQVTLSKYFNKRRKKLNTKQDRKNLQRSQDRMVAFDYGTDYDRKKAKGVLKTYAKKGADYRKEVSAAEKAHQANLKKIRQQHGAMKEDVEQIEERTLSEPETKKKEEYVKGMKKKLSGFKQRYGERAKEVMYATATKMAKKD